MPPPPNLPPVPQGLRSQSPGPRTMSPYQYPPGAPPPSGGPHAPPIPPLPPSDYLRHAAEEQRRDFYGARSPGPQYGPPPGQVLAPSPRRNYNATEQVTPLTVEQWTQGVERWEDRRASSAQPVPASHYASTPAPQMGGRPLTNYGPPPAGFAFGYNQGGYSSSPPTNGPGGPGGFAPRPDLPTSHSYPTVNINPPEERSSYIQQSTSPVTTTEPPRRNSSLVNRPPRVTSMIDTRGGGSQLSSSLSSLSLESSVPPQPSQPGEVAAKMPTQEDLGKMRDDAISGKGRKSVEELKVEWAREVLKFVERHQTQAAAAGEQSRITDPVLVRWTDEGLHYILTAAATSANHPPLPLALYLRGELSSTGSFPSYRQKDPKMAFRDFETAANGGYARAWFKIGREYENFTDSGRAVMAFENGAKKSDCGCVYRLGMAYLLGQLQVPTDPARAIPLLRQAADLSDLDFPQPAYIFGMLLAGEFEHVTVPPQILPVDIAEARKYIERAAYLRYPAAAYKMGFSAEYALLGVQFDPIVSVQYYSLASQAGEVEADMALSKWFLCGAEDCFPVNEDLAFTFAEKAARKGLASAEFAVGYYFEVGIGCSKDVEASELWYTKAAAHGNDDAKDRLSAIQAGGALSRKEHEHQVEDKLVRKRTQAAQRSQKQDPNRPANLVDADRRTAAAALDGGGAPGPSPGLNPNSAAAGRYPQRRNSRDDASANANANGNVNPMRRADTMRQVERMARQAKAQSSRLPPSTPPVGPPPSGPSGGLGFGPPRQGSVGPGMPPPKGVSLSDNGPQKGVSLSDNGPQKGYSLSDQGPAPRPARPPGGPAPAAAGAASPRLTPKGPETFAEMGIKTGKPKGDDCIIM